MRKFVKDGLINWVDECNMRIKVDSNWRYFYLQNEQEKQPDLAPLYFDRDYNANESSGRTSRVFFRMFDPIEPDAAFVYLVLESIPDGDCAGLTRTSSA